MFEEPILKLGSLKFGQVINKTIYFKNTGDVPFKIFHLQGGCICTEPTDWSRGSIDPGDSGFITFIFDTNKASVQKAYSSSIELYGNVDGDMLLYEIEADIIN